MSICSPTAIGKALTIDVFSVKASSLPKHSPLKQISSLLILMWPLPAFGFMTPVSSAVPSRQSHSRPASRSTSDCSQSNHELMLSKRGPSSTYLLSRVQLAPQELQSKVLALLVIANSSPQTGHLYRILSSPSAGLSHLYSFPTKAFSSSCSMARAILSSISDTLRLAISSPFMRRPPSKLTGPLRMPALLHLGRAL